MSTRYERRNKKGREGKIKYTLKLKDCVGKKIKAGQKKKKGLNNK